MNEEPRQYIFVAEINFAVDDVGTVETHWACSGEGFATRPTDTPAHVAVPPTLLDPGSLRREMFSGDKVFGAVRPAFGEVVLFNGDGRYDAWEHHGFDGRPFVLRWGPLGGAYPADFETLVICTVEGITLTENEARLRLRDNTALLDKPVLKDAFTGLTVPEGYIGGIGGGIAGTVKNRYINATAYFGPQPTLLKNTFGGAIYHLSVGVHVGSGRLWDNGNEIAHESIPFDMDFWELSDYPESGHYWISTTDNNVYIRLGSRSVGDLRMFLNVVNVFPTPISMQDLLTEVGFSGSVIGTPLTNIHGAFADTSLTYAKLFDDVANRDGMWYGFDRLGRFVSKEFEAPTGTPLITFSRSNCLSVKRSPVPGMEVPVYQIATAASQAWKSNYTAPGNYIKDRFQTDDWYFKFNKSDPAILVKHIGAKSLDFKMLIGPERPAEFTAMADRYLAMFGVDRSLITAVVPLSAESLAIDLGDVVNVAWPRFNLSAGRLFRVISVRYALRERNIEFGLWG